MTGSHIIRRTFQSLRLKTGSFENYTWGRKLKRTRLITIIALLSLFVIYGCKGPEQVSSTPAVEKSSDVDQNLDCSDASKLITLKGVLVRKEWTKTYESYRAGGSEYYMIEKAILRPSEQVPFSEFEKYKGKKVVVKGLYVKGKPYTPPKDSAEQYPVNPDGTPETINVGAGFKVCEISVVQGDAAEGY
jgi:hypothetical protein